MNLPCLALTLLAALPVVAPLQEAPEAPEAPEAQEAQDAEARSGDAARPWKDADFAPPARLETSRMLLLPLAPEYAELDFEAVMDNRLHLQRTLHWGDWPREDFTLEENRGDLERHWKEFEDREGYAFTVLAPDESRCLGCIYLKPLDPRDPDSLDARMAYWVVEDRIESEFDRHLLQELLAWIERDWPFASVQLPVHVEDGRSLELARALELEEDAEAAAPSHIVFTWRRGEDP